MADEPAADDDAGSPAAGPAVHVDDSAAGELGVDLVEYRDQVRARRDREVADGAIDVAGRLVDERRVRLELTVLSQIEEESHAGIDEVRDFDAPRSRDRARRDGGRR